jgi:hypothetical protein
MDSQDEGMAFLAALRRSGSERCAGSPGLLRRRVNILTSACADRLSARDGWMPCTRGPLHAIVNEQSSPLYDDGRVAPAPPQRRRTSYANRWVTILVRDTLAEALAPVWRNARFFLASSFAAFTRGAPGMTTTEHTDSLAPEVATAQSRREALKKFGQYAAVAPATMLLLNPRAAGAYRKPRPRGGGGGGYG